MLQINYENATSTETQLMNQIALKMVNLSRIYCITVV